MKQAFSNDPRNGTTLTRPDDDGANYLQLVLGDEQVDFTVTAVESRWEKWLTVKKQLLDDWRRDQEARLAKIEKLVEVDRIELALEKLAADRERAMKEQEERDDKLTAEYLHRCRDSIAKVADAAHKARWKRVNAVTKQMDAEVVAAERKRFNVRGRRR